MTPSGSSRADSIQAMQIYLPINHPISNQFKNFEKEAEAFFESHSVDVWKALSSDVKRKNLFVENVQKSTPIEETSLQYQDLISSILDLMDKKTLENMESFDLFGPLSQLLDSFCILDLRIWKQLIQNTLLTPEKFQDHLRLAQTLSSICKFLTRFHFHESLDKSFARYHFTFEESEALSLFSRKELSTFFNKIEKFLSKRLTNKTVSSADIWTILQQTFEICQKLRKISFLDSSEEIKLYQRFKPMILENLQTLSPQETLSTFTYFIQLGIYDQQFYQIIAESFKNLPNDSLRMNFLELLLQSWGYTGEYDRELYEKLIKRIILLSIEKRSNLMPNIVFQLTLVQITDPDLWQRVLQTISKIDFQQLEIFQKKLLHSTFQYLRCQKEMELDFSATLPIENRLSKFCIGLQHGFDYSQVAIPEIEDGKLINCCDQKTIQSYCEAHKKLMSSKSSNYIQKQKLIDQVYKETFQEKIIRNVLVDVFPKFFKTPIKVIPEKPFCTYKIDFALEIPELSDKIAIEVTGLGYTIETGAMFGKKQRKFQFLENSDWIVCPINIGTTIPYSWMSVADVNSKSSFDAIARVIYDVLKKEVEKKLKITLPEVSISKWAKPASKATPVNNKDEADKLKTKNIEEIPISKWTKSASKTIPINNKDEADKLKRKSIESKPF